MTSELLEKYSACEETLKKLYDSRLRLSILDALENGPLRLADLRRDIGSNAPNASSKAKGLEDIGLVERGGGDYILTPWGRAVIGNLKESFGFYATYEKFKEFWTTHDMSQVPEEFIQRIGALYNSELVKCSTAHPIATHEALVRDLQTIQKELYGITPIFHSEWAPILVKLLQNGVKMECVMTDEIIRHFAKMAPPAAIPLFERIKFFVTDKKIPGFMVSDTFLCFAIESKAVPNNYFDMKLFSKDPKALELGKSMFEHFKAKAKPVRLSDYL